MATNKVVVTKSKLDDLARHINAKAGKKEAMTIDEMAATVDSIETRGVLQEKSVDITANGKHDITPDEGNDGISKATINVNVPEPDAKIIDVTQLPTEDIDSETYYRMDGELYKYGAADTSDIVGTWVFDTAGKCVDYLLNKPALAIEFVTNGLTGSEIYEASGMLGYNLNGELTIVGYFETWDNEAYKTIVVSSGSAEALAFLQATATKQGGWECYLVPSGSLEITENGTVDVTDKSEVVVNVGTTLTSAEGVEF